MINLTYPVQGAFDPFQEALDLKVPDTWSNKAIIVHVMQVLQLDQIESSKIPVLGI